jgi:WD40 repeat protein
MLYAFVQKFTADIQTKFAEQHRVSAEKEKAKTDSLIVVTMNTAQEAEREKLFADSQRYLALQNEAIVLKKIQIALEQSDSAMQARIRADQNIQIAIEQLNTTRRLRMLSVSKTMSLKSLQAPGQKDLQSLLAYQAYLFNKNNGGLDNDADIYAGLYDVAKNYGNKNNKTYQGHEGGIRSIAFVPGKKEFFTAGDDGKVLKWSVDQPNQALQIIYSGSEIIEVLVVSPDASWLAMGGANSVIKMVSLNGQEGYEMKGSGGAIKSLIFSFDSKSLYSASLDGKALKWDLALRTSSNLTDGTLPITSIDISFNGKFMAGINAAGEAVVWNQENRADNFRINMESKNIMSIRFNPDGNILALGDIRGNVELWDVERQRKISEVKAHNDQINDIRFNSRLKQMATASNDKSLKIFNVANMTDLTEPPVALTDFDEFVVVIQFSPDGDLIISGSYGGRNNLAGRPAHVDGLVGEICGIVSRDMTQDEWNTYVGRDIPFERTCPDRRSSIIIDRL